MLAGAVAPWISALLTGLPAIYPPVALIMSIGGILLTGTASLLFRMLNHRIWPPLLGAIAANRAVSFLLPWAMASRFGISPKNAAFGTLVEALPGIALQIAVVPFVICALQRRTSVLINAENRG
jgi:hypothetical protein